MLRDTDQRVVMRDLTWPQFLAVAEARGERGNPRLHYLDGLLELMHSSREHEYVAKTISRCLETWSDLVDLRLEGCGSYTMMNRKLRCAAEADDCYYIGAVRRGPPDLVIERDWTTGELDQLELYGRLGVREVWLWTDRRIQRHALVRGGAADIDLGLIKRAVRLNDQPKAVRMIRSALKH